MSLLMPQLMMRKREKISSSSIFERFYSHLRRKFWKFINPVDSRQLEYSKKWMPYKPLLTTVQKWTISLVSSEQNLWKFLFYTSNPHCLEQILCFILLIISSDFELPRVSCSCSHFFISYIYIILFLLACNKNSVFKYTHSQYFQQKTGSGIFVQLSKEPPSFCCLKVNKFWNKIASIASYNR